MNRSRSQDWHNQRALCAAPGGPQSSSSPARTGQDVSMPTNENDSGGGALVSVTPTRRTPRGMRTPPHPQPLPLPLTPLAIGSSLSGYETVSDQSQQITPYSNPTPRGSGQSTTTFMDGPTSASEARLFVQTVQTHAVAAVQAVASGLQAD